MNETASADQPYPESWEDVAEIRVFHTTPEQWERLFEWRNEMKKKVCRPLCISNLDGDLTSVFGRTREELLARNAI